MSGPAFGECGHCTAFVKDETHEEYNSAFMRGFCHRRAPVIVDGKTAWPRVTGTDACGDFIMRIGPR